MIVNISMISDFFHLGARIISVIGTVQIVDVGELLGIQFMFGRNLCVSHEKVFTHCVWCFYCDLGEVLGVSSILDEWHNLKGKNWTTSRMNQYMLKGGQIWFGIKLMITIIEN